MDFGAYKGLKLIPGRVNAEQKDEYNISREQWQFYKDNGYLVIKNFFDFGSLYSFKRRFTQICNGIVPKGYITIVKEKRLMSSENKPEDYVNKLQDIFYDEVFASYAEDPKLVHVVSQFVGDDITAMHGMLINKPPGTGEHPPHQDLYYFPFRPADKIVASWTAIDDVTVENGCLYVLPGSHKEGKLYAHGYTSETLKLYHGILDPTVAPLHKRIDLEMNPGDTVFFHPELIHGSRPNVSKNYRKSISCHFANSNVEYVEVSGTVQEQIANETVQEAKRRGFDDLKFQTSLITKFTAASLRDPPEKKLQEKLVVIKVPYNLVRDDGTLISNGAYNIYLIIFLLLIFFRKYK